MMGIVEEGANVESVYKRRPMYAPKGRETMPVIKTFSEEEARNLPEWGENLSQAEKSRFKMPDYGVPEATPHIRAEMGAHVSRIPIRVREKGGNVYYYELDPVKGGKKGTEVNFGKDFGYTPRGGMPKPVLPKMPKMPDWSFPEIRLPKVKVGLPEIGVGAKAGIGLVLLFIAGIVLLIAIGYSGMGESAGRVGESEYSRKRK
jgi:hypothetical protein